MLAMKLASAKLVSKNVLNVITSTVVSTTVYQKHDMIWDVVEIFMTENDKNDKILPWCMCANCWILGRPIIKVDK